MVQTYEGLGVDTQYGEKLIGGMQPWMTLSERLYRKNGLSHNSTS